QLAAREFFCPVYHAALGITLPLPGPFARCSATPLSLTRSAPRLGEHNAEILGQELGLAAAIIQEQTLHHSASLPRAWPEPPLPQEPPALSRPVPQRLQQPLQDVRVLDFTWYAAGPLGTKYLADHGAQVLKVGPQAHPCGWR